MPNRTLLTGIFLSIELGNGQLTEVDQLIATIGPAAAALSGRFEPA
jgi:hypothetical protein